MMTHFKGYRLYIHRWFLSLRSGIYIKMTIIAIYLPITTFRKTKIDLFFFWVMLFNPNFTAINKESVLNRLYSRFSSSYDSPSHDSTQ